MISEALRKNGADSGCGYNCQYTIVDPYPGEIIRSVLGGNNRLIESQVELMDVEFFSRLKANDILFIDSGHVVRAGGDVNLLILDILPTLRPGVLIHFHDIPMPYEYPEIYFTNPAFRMFWTESYLLQAFLACNSQFQIILAMSYLMMEYRDAVRQAFPHYNDERDPEISGSFWIRKRIE